MDKLTRTDGAVDGPRIGDRVKVTLEGEVIASDPSAFKIGGAWIYPDEPGVTVAIADPEWQPGDVARCSHGFSYLRSGNGLWVTHDGNRVVETCDDSLTLLVRGGRTVPGA